MQEISVVWPSELRPGPSEGGFQRLARNADFFFWEVLVVTFWKFHPNYK